MDNLLANADPIACVVVVLLVDIAKSHRSWGWMRLVAGPSAFSAVPGLLGAKVMGSGHEGGFGLRPSFSRQGLFCVFAGHEAADAFLASDWLRQTEPHLQSWRWLKLEAYASRGRWSGHEIRASAVLETISTTSNRIAARCARR